MACPSTIPGVPELWNLTKGDPDICIAVLDGRIDLEHPCFQGANLTLQRGLCDESAPLDGLMPMHGTHVSSVIFSQHDSDIKGVSPGCRGVHIPVFCSGRGRLSQIDLTRSIEQAVQAGAHIISLSGGQLVDTAEAEDLLEKAVRMCEEHDVLLIAAAGNDGCQCLHVPAGLPWTLAVGAHDESGRPMEFSNYADEYTGEGILALGENIPGAKLGGGTAELSGTSFATPIVAGVAALLMSLQKKSGLPISGRQVREALLSTAQPCDCDKAADECSVRCAMGKLNVTGATRQIMHTAEPATVNAACPGQCSCQAPASPPKPAQVTASEAEGPTGLVYAIGTLGYDFGTEARRDSFKQLMPPVTIDNSRVPANPHDARQMVDYLAQRPPESQALIWTLNLELTPVYALEPVGPFARDVYDSLRDLMRGQVSPEGDTGFVSRISVPGRLAGRTVRLFSGQSVPVVEINNTRGLYGWHVNQLVNSALEAIKSHKLERDEAAVKVTLANFLSRVYFDLRNLGTTSHDRALNFASTNAFQAAHTISHAIGQGLELDDIQVERSAICRMDSDCWDVKLKFFDPENNRRSKRVYRFTIDVSDSLPVTTGEVRTWATAD